MMHAIEAGHFTKMSKKSSEEVLQHIEDAIRGAASMGLRNTCVFKGLYGHGNKILDELRSHDYEISDAGDKWLIEW